MIVQVFQVKIMSYVIDPKFARLRRTHKSNCIWRCQAAKALTGFHELLEGCHLKIWQVTALVMNIAYPPLFNWNCVIWSTINLRRIPQGGGPTLKNLFLNQKYLLLFDFLGWIMSCFFVLILILIWFYDAKHLF